MKWIGKAAFVVALMAGMLVSTNAQPGRNQSGSMGGGIAYEGIAQVVMRRDVQEELALTADQKNKIQQAIAAMRTEMTKAMESRQGGDGRSMMGKLAKKLDGEVNALLTKPQQKRLEELRVQMLGNRAILDPQVQQGLGITDAQRAQIAKAQENQRKAMKDMMEEMRKAGSDRSKVGELLTKMQSDLSKAFDDVLTAEQKAKYTAMKGKPLKSLSGRGG
ncbi:MAG TPA: hypothetical protein PLH94_12195 [Fimbriimonadaceae bacterium]|nr:hypothetical protein [Fimbriimonadaceae bacterium]